MDLGQAAAALSAFPSSPALPTPRRIRRRVIRFAVVAMLLGAGAYGTHWWMTLRFREEADDAYLAAGSQRVPVRVSISTAGLPLDVLARLRPGLSVVASVDTRTQPPGPVRTLGSE